MANYFLHGHKTLLEDKWHQHKMFLFISHFSPGSRYDCSVCSYLKNCVGQVLKTVSGREIGGQLYHGTNQATMETIWTGETVLWETSRRFLNALMKRDSLSSIPVSVVVGMGISSSRQIHSFLKAGGDLMPCFGFIFSKALYCSAHSAIA